MVMKVMRAGTKPILWIVVAAFVGTIIFAWGMEFTRRPTQRGVVGEVNGVDIKLDDYSLMYQNALAQEQQKKGEVTDEEASQLRNQIFDQMVGSNLLLDVTRKVGLSVTNRELAEHLRRFPPQELRNVEYFQTNGQFDYNKYLQAYQNPDPQLWVQIEALVRPRLLQQKLFEYVTEQTVVDDAEVKELYDAATERVRVRYLLAPSFSYLDSIGTLDSAAVLKYYRDNEASFHHGDQAQIEYVYFEKKASADDSAQVQREAADLAKRIRAGEDFAALAKQYSEDPSSQDGDLGWFGRGAMVKPFEDAVFAMDSGQISDPVLTRFGYHIIKAEGKRGRGDSIEVKAAHILLKLEASTGTLSDLRQKAEQFVEDTKSEPFDTLARRNAIYPRRTGWFERGQDIGGIGSNPAIIEFTFNNKPGTVSGVFETPTNFTVAKVTDRKPAGVSTLAEVSGQIMQRLRVEAAQEKAYQVLTAIRSELVGGLPFTEAAARWKLTADSTAPFGRVDQVSSFGDDPVFRGTAFALARSGEKVSPVAKISRGAVVMQLIEHTTPDPQKYTEKRDSIMSATLEAKRQMVFNRWYAQLKQAANIKDFRYQIPGEY